MQPEQTKAKKRPPCFCASTTNETCFQELFFTPTAYQTQLAAPLVRDQWCSLWLKSPKEHLKTVYDAWSKKSKKSKDVFPSAVFPCFVAYQCGVADLAGVAAASKTEEIKGAITARDFLSAILLFVAEEKAIMTHMSIRQLNDCFEKLRSYAQVESIDSVRSAVASLSTKATKQSIATAIDALSAMCVGSTQAKLTRDHVDLLESVIRMALSVCSSVWTSAEIETMLLASTIENLRVHMGINVGSVGLGSALARMEDDKEDDMNDNKELDMLLKHVVAMAARLTKDNRTTARTTTKAMDEKHSSRPDEKEKHSEKEKHNKKEEEHDEQPQPKRKKTTSAACEDSKDAASAVPVYEPGASNASAIHAPASASAAVPETAASTKGTEGTSAPVTAASSTPPIAAPATVNAAATNKRTGFSRFFLKSKAKRG